MGSAKRIILKSENKRFLNNLSIILASGSPRRKELLSEIISEFEVFPSSAEEMKFHPDGPVALISENAHIKAKDISRMYPQALVLGADTMVFLEQKPYGKPESMLEAVQMLKELSGTVHTVATGVSLVLEARGVDETFAVETRVFFRQLDDQMIKEYFEHVDPMDKAGGYAIQTHPEMIIDKWEGSLSNVIGLPLEKLDEKLITLSALLSEDRKN